MTFVSSVNAQTELQKLEESQNQSLIRAKKQIAYLETMEGKAQKSEKTFIYTSPTIGLEQEKMIEDKIKNYRKNNVIILTDNDALNTSVTSAKSEKVPLSEFSNFPINVQKYIVENRAIYESYIKFD